jgi:hypothetical protein
LTEVITGVREDAVTSAGEPVGLADAGPLAASGTMSEAVRAALARAALHTVPPGGDEKKAAESAA